MNEMSAHGGDAVRFGVSSEASQRRTVPRRPRRRPGENRERLLTAGISIFGAHGYHGAQTAAIAALAGVPQPHVYANFSTKQELFLACAERVCKVLAAGVLEVSSDAAALGPAQVAEVERSDYGVFLLQCLAASSEAKLQPALGALLLSLRRQMGEQQVLDLITSSARAMLRE